MAPKDYDAKKAILADIKRTVSLIGASQYLTYPDKSFLKQDTISWGSKAGQIYKGEYSSIFKELLQTKDYSFGVCKIGFDELEDPASDIENIPPNEESLIGLFQFFYTFTGENIAKAKLAFYPDSTKWRNFIRVDLDIKAGKEESHSSCHLQVFDLEEMRIPLRSLPPPSAFIEFCVRHFYPDLHSLIFKELCNHDEKLDSIFSDKNDLKGITIGYQRFKLAK